jgi:hypothetical protein
MIHRIFVCLIVAVVLGVWLPAARGDKPSAEILKRWARHRAKIRQRMAAAKPWEKALEAALARQGFKDRKALARWTLLATYKHYRPALHRGAALRRWARDLARAWKQLQPRCRRLKLRNVDLAEAIYQLTNSDWEPVSCARGPGLNKVRTGAQYLAWGRALIRVATRARQARLNPVGVWHRIAVSLAFKTVAQLQNVNVRRVPPPPKY